MRRLLLIAVVLLMAFAPPPQRSSQARDIRVETQLDYEFGSQATLQAEIYASSPVARAALFIRSASDPNIDVLQADLLPRGGRTLAKLQVDLRRSIWPPFADITYWWQVDLIDGSSKTTVPTVFEYTDNRFEWQSLRSAPITLHWVNGALAFGQQVLDLAHEALRGVEQDALIPLPSSLRIYLYPDEGSLQSALSLAARPWIGGHAEALIGVVLVPASPRPDQRALLERALPHEITHVMLAQRMGDRYENIPAWLNEGLATMEEIAPRPEYAAALQQAAQEENLIPISSLCAAFPDDPDRALLAYAESQSLVRYVRNIYGSGAIVALLDTYQEGADCRGGVQRVLRRSIEQLDAEWRHQALPGTGTFDIIEPLLPWALLAVPALLLASVALLWVRRKPPRPSTTGKAGPSAEG